ncbi:MAG: hypothetical protein E7391_06330 [Ruminococcaceae bacterium]|nr:hypothetical protein [Oscillospiraceae bacterium]
MKKSKIKAFVLKTITKIMAVVWLLSMTALDSESSIPVVACFISLAWIALFMYANGYKPQKEVVQDVG